MTVKDDLILRHIESKTWMLLWDINITKVNLN
jgi:hypothetical protein